jgi:hypothetical protein
MLPTSTEKQQDKNTSWSHSLAPIIQRGKGHVCMGSGLGDDQFGEERDMRAGSDRPSWADAIRKHVSEFGTEKGQHWDDLQATGLGGPRKRHRHEPVTLGQIRSLGCRDLLIYCASGRCHHSAALNADWLADQTPVRSLCGRMVCTRCGMIGADVRPDWRPHVNKRQV